MKRLYLLRHAKSDWATEAGSDHERPLAPRGRRSASTIGRFLAQQPHPPDRIVSSTAVRARSTAEIAVESGGLRCALELEERLYGGSPETLLAVMREASDEAESLMLVGHEPTWSVTAERLVGRCNLRFVTGALARIDLSIGSWSGARFESGTLAWLVTPKLLQRFGG